MYYYFLLYIFTLLTEQLFWKDQFVHFFLPAALSLLLSTAFKQARTIQNCMIHVLVRSSGTVELISEWHTVLIHFARAICEGLVVREAEVMPSYGTYLQWMYYCNLHGEPLVLLGLRISPSSSFYFWLILSEGGAKEDTLFFSEQSPFTYFCSKNQS